ncbi:MAG: two-component regulator propeller domain-containing protein [Bacteroidota bacterium]
MKTGLYLFLIFIINCLFLSTVKSFAQQYNFRSYTVEDGLAQSTGNEIIQDRNGYLWIATSGGVSKFNGLSFQNITTLEGLINNRVLSIIEDSEGFIWLGTSEGISIINPNFSFKTNTLNIINITIKNGLIGNSVRAIFIDTKENIWFGTTNGISKLDSTQSKWEQLKQLAKSTIDFEHFTTEDGLVHNTINHITEDSRGNLWFATNGGVSILIRNVSIGPYDYFENFTTDNGLSHNVIYAIFEDKDGIIWIATQMGLLKVAIFTDQDTPSDNDYVSGTIKSIVNFDDSLSVIISKPTKILSILQDQEGDLWFNRNKYDNENNKYFSMNSGLEGGSVISLLEDREGNIWFGKTEGISRYSSNPFKTYNIEHGVSYNEIRAVIEDKKGNIWLGTAKNLSKFHPKNTEENLLRFGKGFEIFFRKDGLVHLSIWSLLEDKYGNIWIGTGTGLSKYIPPSAEGEKGRFKNFIEKDVLKNVFMALYEDTKGNLWAGTFGGVLKLELNEREEIPVKNRFYTTNEGLINNRISAIYEDRGGNIWVGTSGGLSMFRFLENDSIIIENFTTKDGLVNNKVLSIAEDNKGNLWFGTGRGISKYTYQVYTGSRGIFENFTAKEGLSSDTPYLLIFDNEGYLYVGTNKGVDKFDINVRPIKKIKHFGKLEGFFGIETNHNAACKDQDGNIWFGTVSGAIKYNPKLDKSNTVEPLTHINNIQLFLENFDWSGFSDTINFNTGLPEGLILPYDKNYLSFHFTGISLTIPEKVRYIWKMEGFDENWSPITQKTDATYSNLPPGKYTFMVKACNNDGLWNEKPAKFSFIITPPFWKTWWFYLLCFLAGSGGIYSFIKMRERNLQRAKKILEHKVKIRTEEVVRQKEEIEKQKELVEEKNKGITDSINYAKRIQEAILPLSEEIKDKLPDSFILFKPRDIVSGDFYWFYSSPTPDTSPTLLRSKLREGEEGGESNRPNPQYQTADPGLYEMMKEKAEMIDIERKVSLSASWRKGWGGAVIIAAADCTGHGVPGAFMSMLGNAFLNEIVNEKGIIRPNEILEKLREEIIKALKQSGEKAGSKDGMDIALCHLSPALSEGEGEPARKPSPSIKSEPRLHRDKLRGDPDLSGTGPGGVSKTSKYTLEFAGANNPLYIVRKVLDEEPGICEKNQPPSPPDFQPGLAVHYPSFLLEEIKGDRQPVSISSGQLKPFTNHTVELHKGDTFYIFSDGYIDQFGGAFINKEKYGGVSRKFMSKRFKQLLLDIQKMSMEEQEEVLDKTFEDWKGDEDQIDDILVIGVRV